MGPRVPPRPPLMTATSGPQGAAFCLRLRQPGTRPTCPTEGQPWEASHIHHNCHHAQPPPDVTGCRTTLPAAQGTPVTRADTAAKKLL